jgi:hypothetical protein
MPVIPEYGRLRQEDYKFKVSRGYIARPYLKKNSDLKENHNTYYEQRFYLFLTLLRKSSPGSLWNLSYNGHLLNVD